MSPTLEQLILALQRSWCAETSYADSDWPADNPARGQCVVSSLVVQDYFGGELVRYAVKGDGIDEMHYCNMLEGGVLLDTTRSQYQTPMTFTFAPVELKQYTSIREKRLDDDETRQRYELLQQRVAAYLAQK